MVDKIEFVGKSIIQYGKKNNRIYLMKLNVEDFPDILDYLDNLAKNEGYTKIVAKAPHALKDSFLEYGYEPEACVSKFYNGEEDAYFLSKFFSDERKELSERNNILDVTQFCIDKGNSSEAPKMDKKFSIKSLEKEHIPQMLDVFKAVFESYPFPIFNGNYLFKTMRTNIDYFGVFKGEKLLAVSSAEMDFEHQNAEMTDFATLPDFRGKNFSYHLLKHMEKTIKQKEIKTTYTIARAKSKAMNMTFAKSSYEFGGTLVKNTNICGNIETMNVWYKNLH